jgi:hypothetical protein
MFSPTADTIAFAEGGTEVARFDSSGNLGVGTSSPQFRIDARSDTPAFFGATNGDGTRYGFTSALPSNSGNCYVGWIPETIGTGGVNGDLGLVPRTSAGANIRFFTGSTSASERMRINSAGDLLINTTSILGSGKVSILYDGAVNHGCVMRNTKTTASTDDVFIFQRVTTQVGNITTTLTNTQYNTSSDYRLKENIAPMTGALATVTQLKPCTYTWKSTGEASQGFIAHELAEVVPDAVTGGKDAVNEDGSIKPQAIDTSFLVATLTAAIQELNAKVIELEAKLESK